MKHRVKRLTALFLALSLLLTACSGGNNIAATMHLVKTEGTVQVNNEKGKSVKPRENLGLFSGYALSTQAASYGWINMDSTKLAKIDAQSQVDIIKEDKLLELKVRSGNLFFNVTKPLDVDETMNIRTSTMVVGIRGTCGWVEVEDEDLMCVYLLRGRVDCMVLDKNSALLALETITAGQAALMRLEDGEASITVAEFDVQQLPDFVQDALDNPEDWSQPGDLEGQEGGGSVVGGPKILSRSQYRTDNNRIDEYDEFLYDEQGNNIGFNRYMRDGDQWFLYRVFEFTYDNRGRVQEMRISSAEELRSTLAVIEETPDSVTLNEGNVAGRWTYYYNDLGQCIEERFHNRSPAPEIDDHEPLIYNAVTFQYDDQGKIISSDCYRTEMVDPITGATEINHYGYYVYEYEGDPGAPSGLPALTEEAPRAEETPGGEQVPEDEPDASPLAAYAGTYTMYPEYETYRSGYGGTTVTLNADGTVTGGAVDGRTPSNIRQESNGSIVIQYSGTMWFTLYPANGPTPSAAWYESSQVNLEFMDASGGLAVLVYHADPASVGTP